MMPEETDDAHIDLQGDVLMPIHWGAFKLALHSWTDPVERIIKKAKEMDVDIVVPKIGEPIIINEKGIEQIEWWK